MLPQGSFKYILSTLTLADTGGCFHLDRDKQFPLLRDSRRLHNHSNYDIFTFYAMAGSLFRVILHNNAELIKAVKKSPSLQ